jgi:hypothetical protein
MRAIPNKVVIGDENAPILTFYNDSIKNVTEETAVSPIGDELFIDQFVPIVSYNLLIQYILTPADQENYNGLISADGYVLCSRYNYDIRNIPYGTPVRFYVDGKINGLFYCNTVDRQGKNLFKINCMSAVGLMNRQRSKGGIYTGQRFDAVAAEIMGDEYSYEIEPDVAELQVFGWLPYSTRRRNLHQLLVAFGVTITRSDTGGMLFTFLKAVDSQKIPSNRVFNGGSVVYGEPASRVEVLEHGYHYLSTTEYEVLYDTQAEAVENVIVTFDKPVYAPSLTVEEGGDLTISSSGTNYAVVSGTGVLKGKPYVHTVKRLTADNAEALTEKIVTVEEATLVTMANSENVLARLSAYYFHATTVQNSIIVDGEMTGKRYSFENAFHEPTNAFLTKKSTMVSSFLKAECEWIQDYMPVAEGTSFGKRAILELKDTEQRWNIPDSVYAKDVPQIRCVLIGHGSDGESGTDGKTGSKGDDDGGGPGGAGGKGGKGGTGGKVYSVTIDCANLAFLRYKNADGNTLLYAADDVYSSANGHASSSGFVELFSGAVYALPGNGGVDGAAGGKGGRNPPIGSSPQRAANGEDVEYNGVKYKGGKGGKTQDFNGAEVGTSANLTIKYGGTGGGGAAYGVNGHDGGTGGWKRDADGNFIEQDGWIVLDIGGEGADAADAIPTLDGYGNGGNGGNGGGGGGGATAIYWWNHEYSTLISTASYPGGNGGKGSAGTKGNAGVLIIYY